MRIGALLVLLLALPGCAVFRREPPPWSRPAPVSTGPATSTSGTSGTSVGSGSVTGPGAGVGASSAAATPTPPPAAPAAPPAAPPSGPPPAPNPALTASLPPAEMRRLQDDAERRIEEAERLLRQIEGRPLAPKELETWRLAQSLVEQARKALGGGEYERAANLAAKARTLADDLSTHR